MQMFLVMVTTLSCEASQTETQAKLQRNPRKNFMQDLISVCGVILKSYERVLNETCILMVSITTIQVLNKDMLLAAPAAWDRHYLAFPVACKACKEPSSAGICLVMLIQDAGSVCTASYLNA